MNAPNEIEPLQTRNPAPAMPESSHEAPPLSPAPNQVEPAFATTQPPLDWPTQITARLTALADAFEKRLAYDKTKEEAFNRLYAELEELKKNSALEQLRPLFIDLVLLYDRIESAGQLVAAGQSSAPETAALVRTLRDELIEILSRREVEQIVSAADTFDPSIHRAVGVEPVESEAQGGRVARVARRGFRLGNRILRPEEVVVTKCTAKKPQG